MTKKLTAWDKEEQQYLAVLRWVIRVQGNDKFGPISIEIETQLNQIEDQGRLEQIALKLLKVSNWEEALAVPEP